MLHYQNLSSTRDIQPVYRVQPVEKLCWPQESLFVWRLEASSSLVLSIFTFNRFGRCNLHVGSSRPHRFIQAKCVLHTIYALSKRSQQHLLVSASHTPKSTMFCYLYNPLLCNLRSFTPVWAFHMRILFHSKFYSDPVVSMAFDRRLALVLHNIQESSLLCDSRGPFPPMHHTFLVFDRIWP